MSFFINKLIYCILVRLLREELQLLQEQGSYVGEVVKPMDKKKVLVKVLLINSTQWPYFTQMQNDLFENMVANSIVIPAT